jgi:signal transduction histidine kinase
VTNVLINAVEAGDGTGTLQVSVQPHTHAGAAAVRVAVRDNGPGIAPALLPRIFDPYVTSKPGGTGLGLAIARQTIEAHGGVVQARSTPGDGTEIAFVLPLASSVETTAPGVLP